MCPSILVDYSPTHLLPSDAAWTGPHAPVRLGIVLGAVADEHLAQCEQYI
jgi:hypothetical protein